MIKSLQKTRRTSRKSDSPGACERRAYAGGGYGILSVWNCALCKPMKWAILLRSRKRHELRNHARKRTVPVHYSLHSGYFLQQRFRWDPCPTMHQGTTQPYSLTWFSLGRFSLTFTPGGNMTQPCSLLFLYRVTLTKKIRKLNIFVLIFHTYSAVTEHSSLTSCADREIVGRLGLAWKCPVAGDFSPGKAVWRSSTLCVSRNNGAIWRNLSVTLQAEAIYFPHINVSEYSSSTPRFQGL